ncbi:malto-oligosyltrehalose synthase [Mesorhizobium sp. CA4]|uniref:malto-oligosyltrehalose synthase n=1 Tax=Mesorhizobium sp. CA4 TaxID=588499 RepID=UPI001CD06E9F|nr:malto-oligosyltrehalose synthase [Mesorhizobium sp. CA4]MBZ9822165.1 malto-oligosyltrehalose synthase [Mesorhizobium sp. CA4]
MHIPIVATYRLQFRNGMTFYRAAEIIPYLKQLGISHLYASPIFSAETGSTHGYDVVDHNEIDPAIGGIDGFRRLHRALRSHDMGLILDIVPNHMAASLENRWWRSVVERGKASPFAGHFDIDWGRKLTLPRLGRPYREALEAGELRIEADAKESCLALGYFDSKLPLLPASYRLIAERLEGDVATALRDVALIGERPERDADFHDAVGVLLARDNHVLAESLDALSRELGLIDDLHKQQPWELIYWRDARRNLSYRRFFEVTGLVGVRVEDGQVFADVHRLALSLVAEGLVNGLRIDHVDGLACPTSYLRKLRQEVGPDIPVFVEKILAEGEELPGEWPISGTTGYEFIPTVADLLADVDGLAELVRDYERFIGRHVDLDAETREAKRLILRRNFEGELAALVRLAQEIRQRAEVQQAGDDDILNSIAEIIVGFDVYRTYAEPGRWTGRDEIELDRATASALASGRADPELIAFIKAMLSGAGDEDATTFFIRFQQLTGPVMAKAVEDTLYYRVNPFIADNEVGCSPGSARGGVRQFHRRMASWVKGRSGMLATATHDTKRGEDARTRLYSLTCAPSVWADSVGRWAKINEENRRALPGGFAPEPDVEWLLYQSLAGVWPPLLRIEDEHGLAELSGRFLPYVEKALREAKLRTDWLDADEAYEKGVLSYARALLEPANRTFLEDFAATLRPFVEAGSINSITQTLVKLTAAGIPDFYQGSEGLDFSLVDPDNRRPVNFANLERRLNQQQAAPGCEYTLVDGSFKQWMISRALACRRENETLFARGTYRPVEIVGSESNRFTAFLRELDDHAALVVVQRRAFGRESDGLRSTFLLLPERYDGGTFEGILTGTSFQGQTFLPIGIPLGGLPTALALARLR